MLRSRERFGGGGGSKEDGDGTWLGKRRAWGAIRRDVLAAAMCARRVVKLCGVRINRRGDRGTYMKSIGWRQRGIE
jgi:hypothetical protein